MADLQAIPANPLFQDLTGKVFNRLTVIRYGGRTVSHGQHTWICQCECGNVTRPVRGCDLKSHHIISCGRCLRRRTSSAIVPHGRNRTTEHIIWGRMKQRCLDPNCPAFPRYGGKQPNPITICKRWLDFPNFFADMGEKPKDLTLERLNNDQGYHCGHCEECLANGWELNCAWRGRKEQARNRRSNRLLTHEGLTLTVAEWAERSGIHSATITSRIKRGWSLEKTLTAPLDPRGSSPRPRKKPL